MCIGRPRLVAETASLDGQRADGDSPPVGIEDLEELRGMGWRAPRGFMGRNRKPAGTGSRLGWCGGVERLKGSWQSGRVFLLAPDWDVAGWKDLGWIVASPAVVYQLYIIHIMYPVTCFHNKFLFFFGSN